MSASVQLSKKSLPELGAKALALFNQYAVLLFMALLVATYSFVVVKLLAAHGAQPSESDISAQVQAAATPHIDPKVVEQMQSLQDHSVNVKTLFDQARNNPFQE